MLINELSLQRIASQVIKERVCRGFEPFERLIFVSRSSREIETTVCFLVNIPFSRHRQVGMAQKRQIVV